MNMLDEVQQLIKDLNKFQFAAFWSESNIQNKTRRKLDKAINKVKILLIKEKLM